MSEASGGSSNRRSVQALFFFLIATFITGLLFRWEMAGFSREWIEHLDLRRAHSHLGFYGVLFPAAWIIYRAFRQWAPGPRVMRFYVTLVVLSAIGFLWQGYGPLAIAGSTGVLGVWLLFAWKNRPGRRFIERDWTATAAPSVLLSAAMIPGVAVMTHRDPALANQLARAFLTVLLFGVFLPAILRLVGAIPPRAFAWFLAALASAVFLTGLASSWAFAWIFGLGLVWLMLEILRSLVPDLSRPSHLWNRDRRLLLLWCIFAVALGFTGSGILPYTHFHAIAGIHFLVLGPVLMTIALIHLQLRPHPVLRLLYEGSFLVMVSAIALQSVPGVDIILLQRIAALSGTALLGSVILIAQNVTLDST